LGNSSDSQPNDEEDCPDDSVKRQCEETARLGEHLPYRSPQTATAAPESDRHRDDPDDKGGNSEEEQVLPHGVSDDSVFPKKLLLHKPKQP
jgi:hypothetical protein